jgi:hypothetical protein
VAWALTFAGLLLSVLPRHQSISPSDGDR